MVLCSHSQGKWWREILTHAKGLYQLRHIPSLGPSGVVTSYIDAFKYILHGHEMIEDGYHKVWTCAGNQRDNEHWPRCKYYRAAFKIPTMSRWLVVVSGPQMFDDIRQATDEQLSFREAIAEVCLPSWTYKLAIDTIKLIQTDYMIGPKIRRDPYHVKSVRMQLTRNLGARFSDIKDEISAAFNDLIPAKDNGIIHLHLTRLKNRSRKKLC